MSEPIPCPNCGSLLRIPPGTAMVRCPGCQTVLAVEADDGSPPPAPAVPAAPTAPPLPFGRPARPTPAALPLPFGRPAKPVAARPAAPPAARAVPSGPAKRAKLAPVEPLAADAPPSEREKRQDIERQLAELDEQERRAERRFDVLTAECGYGRVGMKFFAAGAAVNAASALLFSLFMASTFTPFVLVPAALLSAGLIGVHWVLTLIGFGYGVAGPKPARTLCVVGIVVTLGQMILAVGGAAVLLALFTLGDFSYAAGNQSFLIAAMLLGNVFNNLSIVADLPMYLILGALDRPQILILPMIGGGFEFAKLSILGVLTNRMAVEGKDPELGHDGMRFVYRIFFLVLCGGAVKLTIWTIVKLTGGEPLLLMWFVIPMALAINGYYLWWAFAWYAQYQVMMDTAEIITPDRFADRRERLDVV